jgi:hypothetical protein
VRSSIGASKTNGANNDVFGKNTTLRWGNCSSFSHFARFLTSQRWDKLEAHPAPPFHSPFSPTTFTLLNQTQLNPHPHSALSTWCSSTYSALILRTGSSPALVPLSSICFVVQRVAPPTDSATRARLSSAFSGSSDQSWVLVSPTYTILPHARPAVTSAVHTTAGQSNINPSYDDTHEGRNLYPKDTASRCIEVG